MNRRYRVVAPWQVHHAGVTYGPGEVVDVPDVVAAPWVAAGWVEPAEDKPKRRK